MTASIPTTEAWTDAASWPVPFGAHDLDSTITGEPFTARYDRSRP